MWCASVCTPSVCLRFVSVLPLCCPHPHPLLLPNSCWCVSLTDSLFAWARSASMQPSSTAMFSGLVACKKTQVDRKGWPEKHFVHACVTYVKRSICFYGIDRSLLTRLLKVSQAVLFPCCPLVCVKCESGVALSETAHPSLPLRATERWVGSVSRTCSVCR